MDLLFYSLSFAEIPVSAVILLFLSVIVSAIPTNRIMKDVIVLLLVTASVSIALIAEADILLLAAGVLLVLAFYATFYRKRRRTG